MSSTSSTRRSGSRRSAARLRRLSRAEIDFTKAGFSISTPHALGEQRRLLDRVAEHRAGAAGRGQQPEDGTDEGGLARTIRSDESDDSSDRHLEGDVVECGQVAETFGQSFGRDCGVHGFLSGGGRGWTAGAVRRRMPLCAFPLIAD